MLPTNEDVGLGACVPCCASEMDMVAEMLLKHGLLRSSDEMLTTNDGVGNVAVCRAVYLKCLRCFKGSWNQVAALVSMELSWKYLLKRPPRWPITALRWSSSPGFRAQAY